MNRHDEIKNAYRSLGKEAAYAETYRVLKPGASLQNRLAGMYQQTEVQTVEAMACFRCRKG